MCVAACFLVLVHFVQILKLEGNNIRLESIPEWIMGKIICPFRNPKLPLP